ncbi:zinc ribbon domain-containing protein [Amedibacillus sp. YH-ame10]
MEKKYMALIALAINLIGGILVLVSTMSFEMLIKLHDIVNIVALLVILVGIVLYLKKMNIVSAVISAISGIVIFLASNGNVRTVCAIALLASCFILYKNYRDLLKTVNRDEINALGKKISKVVSSSMVMDKENVVCEKCGKSYSNEINFCPDCGTPKSNKRNKNICSSCGIEVDEKIKFCPSCGQKIGE